MSDRQSLAARRRWADVPPAERVAKTSAAVHAAVARRRLGSALLAAVEASGLRVELTDDEQEPS